MEPYKPEQWHDLFVMIGAAAGTLVGLFFVVVSVLTAWMLMFGMFNEAPPKARV